MSSFSRLLCLALALPSAFAFEYLIGVGKDETTGKKGLGFDPSVIHPAVGDVIAFEFRSGSHSAVQSTFETPCVPLEGGFNSGIFTVDNALPVDAPGLPSVRVTVNDTNPLWFFDQAGGECAKGAVFAVNPTTTQTPALFKDNAATSPAPPPTTDTPADPSASDDATTPSASDPAPATPTGSANPLQFDGLLVLGGLVVSTIATRVFL